jgi:F-type H+-transporting ATPase subunit gamma
MASLKALRARINSVKNTRKITSAMKMVAASKLRRAQSQAEAARPYAVRMERMLAALAASAVGSPTAPQMLAGTGKDKVHLLIVVTADRGLAGAFNTNVGRAARNLTRRLMGEGKTVKIVTVGRKGRDYLRRELADNIIAEISYAGKKRIEYSDVREIGMDVVDRLGRDEFDVATVIFNRFQSVISQIPTEIQLIPPVLAGTPDSEPEGVHAIYEFEPDEETILARLLPKNLEVQLYRTLLESGAGEQGARMSAMDNATRNAGEAIKKLTLNYNRTRQANITRELIEIISGAEAL